MDYATHYQRVLDHYVRLRKLDSWKHYAKAQIERMAADCPELYRQLPDQVLQRVKEETNGSRRN